MYYFVVLEIVPKVHGHAANDPPHRVNAIIQDIHPLIWATRPIEPFDSHYTTIVLWWCEIPAEVANSQQVIDYIN